MTDTGVVHSLSVDRIGQNHWKHECPSHRIRVIPWYGRPTGNTRLMTHYSFSFKHDHDNTQRQNQNYFFFLSYFVFSTHLATRIRDKPMRNIHVSTVCEYGCIRTSVRTVELWLSHTQVALCSRTYRKCNSARKAHVLFRQWETWQNLHFIVCISRIALSS